MLGSVQVMEFLKNLCKVYKKNVENVLKSVVIYNKVCYNKLTLKKGGKKKMFQLKHKVQGEELAVESFNTLQEVADRIKFLTEAKTLADVLKAQKEFNIRFYLTWKK